LDVGSVVQGVDMQQLGKKAAEAGDSSFGCRFYVINKSNGYFG
jgi:hypothetical protein